MKKRVLVGMATLLLSLLNAVITPAGISCAISNERERSKVAIPTTSRVVFIRLQF